MKERNQETQKKDRKRQQHKVELNREEGGRVERGGVGGERWHAAVIIPEPELALASPPPVWGVVV